MCSEDLVCRAPERFCTVPYGRGYDQGVGVEVANL